MSLRLDQPFGWGGGARKAAFGPGTLVYANDIPLARIMDSPQKRAAAALRAYKVGWFYKAERKISEDISGLKVTVSPEDVEGDNEEAVIEPDLYTPWDRLDPIGQFLRLMERPNPSQTGRQLRAKTQIRLDMAGTAFWYLENALFGLPTAIYGISPSRMFESRDRAGNLIGWVMDRDKPGGGIPFEPPEILPFATASAEDGDLFGVGILDAVYSELPLADLMARHTTDLLTTGGRLAGMLSPKTGSLTEDEFQDAQRAWRNVASDPNAARRLLLFPEPMEYQAGSSTPADIGIPALSTLNRDNILTAFPISPYQLGVPMPGGLNSAETRREDRHDYWEGTIHPRVELLEETIQIGLLARYEAIVGATYDFDITEPNLDTASSLIEKVAALKALIDTGFDDKAAVDAVGLDHIKYLGPIPVPAVPVGAPPPGANPTVVVTTQGRERVNETVAKAAPIERQRDKVVQPATRKAKTALGTFLQRQQRRVEKRLRDSTPQGKRTKADPGRWWDSIVETLELEKVMRGIYVQVGKGSLQSVADNLGRIVAGKQVEPIVNDLLRYGGNRIADINAKTLQSLTTTLAEGTRRGYSLNQLIDGVPTENFSGVKGTTLDNGTEAFSDLRAETIARTETMLSYNRATVTGYGSFGVERLLAIDGDQDEPCADRNGEEFPIDEALGIEDHPNGTLVWSPVVGEKALDIEERIRAHELAVKAIDLDIARAAPPTITVNTPDVHVAPPSVNVAAPNVVVDTRQFAEAIDDLRTMLNKPKTRRVERDENGRAIAVHEE